ncbi:MAG: hypothetical protein U9N06_01635 [candidate division WOR-3 bacterium]|mgnify:CR=1 FL=1|nr:hypothetical protein [candidate division WOR-3 bacterium]
MYSLKDIKEKEDSIYKAIVIMGKEAKWLSSFQRTTIEVPFYKAIEHFIQGKINYEIKEED